MFGLKGQRRLYVRPKTVGTFCTVWPSCVSIYIHYIIIRHNATRLYRALVLTPSAVVTNLFSESFSDCFPYNRNVVRRGEMSASCSNEFVARVTNAPTRINCWWEILVFSCTLFLFIFYATALVNVYYIIYSRPNSSHFYLFVFYTYFPSNVEKHAVYILLNKLVLYYYIDDKCLYNLFVLLIVV
jgi:hypothetical protein